MTDLSNSIVNVLPIHNAYDDSDVDNNKVIILVTIIIIIIIK